MAQYPRNLSSMTLYAFSANASLMLTPKKKPSNKGENIEIEWNESTRNGLIEIQASSNIHASGNWVQSAV